MFGDKMTILHSLIVDFALDTQNPDKSYALGLEYENLGQTASAITYYLRCAERTQSEILAYECLIRMALCFERQGNRSLTVRMILRHAICLLPKRPEAYYFMSRSFEMSGGQPEKVDSYTWSQLGLSVADHNLDPIDGIGYPGKYGLIFQKAVAAWHWGKSHESRKLFGQLCEEYHGEMRQDISNAVQSNLLFLGSGPESDSYKQYDNLKHKRLKYKFPGSENIKHNYSQVYQDLFVLSMLKGKKNGKFLELGAYKAFRGNNTALLEIEYDWNGVAIEYVKEFADDYDKNRKSKIICADALVLNYNKILSELAPDGVVDYLQMDLEPPHITFEALLCIPFDKFKFGVITYEHDHYIDVTKSFRNKSRAYLRGLGYVLVAGNVSPNESCPFEDWWVHPDVVDMEHVKQFMVDKDINEIEKYMLD